MFEGIVVSLDTAKKLREVGIELQTIFYWMQITDEAHGIKSDWHLQNFQSLYMFGDDYSGDVEIYPAPTAEELRKLLPISVFNQNAIKYNIGIGLNDMTICYILDDLDYLENNTFSYLIRNGLVTTCRNYLLNC